MNRIFPWIKISPPVLSFHSAEICLYPEVYSHLTHLLSTLANGRLVLALEGGYRIDGVALSVSRCVSALLGDPVPRLSAPRLPDWSVNPRAATAIRNVASVLSPYWANLKHVHCPLTSDEKIAEPVNAK
jgi:hypothetical protein